MQIKPLGLLLLIRFRCNKRANFWQYKVCEIITTTHRLNLRRRSPAQLYLYRLQTLIKSLIKLRRWQTWSILIQNKAKPISVLKRLYFFYRALLQRKLSWSHRGTALLPLKFLVSYFVFFLTNSEPYANEPSCQISEPNCENR